MALEETGVLIDDLNLMRNALAANLQFHQATDIANAQCNMTAVRYRPITNASSEALDRVNGILGDYLLAQHMDEPVTEQPEAEEPEVEPEEELSPNPLNSPKLHTQQRRKSLAGKNLGLNDGKTPDEFAEAQTVNDEGAGEE